MSNNADHGAPPVGHGAFCWTEIASTDLEKARSFYENVFGWKFSKSSNTEGEMEYLEFSSFGGDEPDGGLYQMQPEMFGGTVPPSHFALYVAVDNIEQSEEKLKELGGEVVFGPYDIPKVGRMLVASDPSGAAITLMQLTSDEG